MSCTSTSHALHRWGLFALAVALAWPGAGIAQVRRTAPDWGAPAAQALKVPASPAARAATTSAADAARIQADAPLLQALADAQRLHGERRLKFNIAANEALGYPPTNLRGLQQQWQQAARVNATAAIALRDEEAALARLPGGSPLVGGLARSLPQRQRSAGAGRFDWREFNVVTPLQNQGSCGSCWAFAAAAAFESSYRMRNDIGIDLSEQEMLDCGPANCKGGYSADVFRKAQPGGAGLLQATDYAGYSAAKAAQCMRRTDSPALHAVAWGYVDDKRAVPTIAQLKQALVDHGPLAVGLYAGKLFQAYRPLPGARDGEEVFTYNMRIGDSFGEQYPDEQGKLHQTWLKMDRNGDLRGTDRGDLLSDLDALGRAWLAVDHMVLLVGWDDRRQAWLVKNSWGAGWGLASPAADLGYGWVAYGQGNIGAYATWVRATLGPLARAAGETVQSQAAVLPPQQRPAPPVATPIPVVPGALPGR